MPCGWEGYRRSGFALAIRRRLQWFICFQAQSLRKGGYLQDTCRMAAPEPRYGPEVQQTSVQKQTHLLCPFPFQAWGYDHLACYWVKGPFSFTSVVRVNQSVWCVFLHIIWAYTVSYVLAVKKLNVASWLSKLLLKKVTITTTTCISWHGSHNEP